MFRYMKNIWLIIVCLLPLKSGAQALEGVVTYEKTFFWSKIYDKLTYLSEEERSRIKTTWGSNDEGDKSKGLLVVTPTKSKYEDMEQEADGGYRWRKSDFMITRDFENEKILELDEFSGKTYIIEDSLRPPVWKVMNKIKEVNGYLCMMATSEDTIKGQKITAWFANDIVSSAGPERYFGLPGLIMEVDVNDGELIITALKVEKKAITTELDMPKKLKGKKVTNDAYMKMIKDYINDSIKSRRNPYWNIRY